MIKVFISICVICVSICLIFFTCFICKYFLGEIFSEPIDKYSEINGVRKYHQYIEYNIEKLLPSFDSSDRDVIVNVLFETAIKGKWR